METQANKKVLCLICTCMDSNRDLVAHTVPFCSTVIVLALKKKYSLMTVISSQFIK